MTRTPRWSLNRYPQRLHAAGWALDGILDLLARYHQRATYGAVAGVLGTHAAFLMQGRPRDHRHSWVVNRKTRMPTGYLPQQCDPRLQAHAAVLATREELLQWLRNPS